MMHKINLQAENCCTEKKNGRPRPEFCPDCCLSGRSSKLTFSFIGLSTGIWICPNAKCNFPLNSANLQSCIDAMDSLHDEKWRLQNKPLRRKKHCVNCYRSKACDFHRHQSPKNSSLVISKTKRGIGKRSPRNIALESIISNSEFEPLNSLDKNEMQRKYRKWIDKKNECGNVSLLSETASPWKNSLNITKESGSVQASKHSVSKSYMHYEEIEQNVDHENFGLLAKYAPFVSKRLNEGDNEPGFIILGSTVLDVDSDEMATDKKQNSIEECYDSAYSSPTSDEINLQNDFIPGADNLNPNLVSALKMIDSIFDDEIKDENVLNPDFFLDGTLDILQHDIDLNDLC